MYTFLVHHGGGRRLAAPLRGDAEGVGAPPLHLQVIWGSSWGWGFPISLVYRCYTIRI